MFDQLLILFTLALIVLAHFLRALLALRLATDMLLGQIKLSKAAVVAAFLATNITLFLLPPMAVHADSSRLQNKAEAVFFDVDDIIATRQAAYDRALSLPIPQLITELAEANISIAKHYHPEAARPILRPPTTTDAISTTERQLGIRFDEVYRKFLETSNGFVNLWGDPQQTNYLLLPLEQIKRFAQLLPELASRLEAAAWQEDPLLANIVVKPTEDEYREEILTLNQLSTMLLIGWRRQGSYLLLDLKFQPDSPASVIFLYEGLDGLRGRRYKSLHDYLADELSKIEASGLY